MTFRAGRWALLGALVIGAWLAVREGIEHRKLVDEYRRLRELVGELQVEHPRKIYLTAIQTNDPLYFVWRIYLPAEETYRWQTATPHGSSTGGASRGAHEPPQSFIRCRLRMRDGQLQKFNSWPGGSSFSTFGDAEVAERLTDAANQLRSKQLGQDGPVQCELSDVITLLRLEFTDEFRQEVLADEDDPGRHKLLGKPLLVFQFGTEEAFARAKDQGDEEVQP